MTSYLQVTTTVESKHDAERLAEMLVTKKVAACAQVSGPISSTYVWNTSLNTGQEWVVTVKTRDNLYVELERTIHEHHTYETPEIIAVTLTHVSNAYAIWMESVLASNIELS